MQRRLKIGLAKDETLDDMTRHFSKSPDAPKSLFYFDRTLAEIAEFELVSQK